MFAEVLTVRKNNRTRACFACLVDEIIDKHADKKTAADIKVYSQSEGSDSALVKSLKGVKAANESVLWDKFAKLIDEAKSDPTSVRAMDKDDVAGLAAEFSITPRDIRAWRKSQLSINLVQKPATKEEVADFVFTSGDTLEKMLNELIAEGLITKKGDMYDLSESTRQQLAEGDSVSSN